MGHAATRTIRVLIADDHRLFAEALSSILAGEADLEIVGVAPDGGAVVELARAR